MADYLQISTATETQDAAVALARSAVAARLAAGAQIVGPVVSVFWHHGEQGIGEEWQLLLRTTAEGYLALQQHLIDHHPWDNPEVVATPIVEGAPGYLRWVSETTAGG